MEVHTLDALDMAQSHSVPPTVPELQSRGRHVEVFTACHRLLGGAYQDGHLSATRFYRYLYMFVTHKDGYPLQLRRVDAEWNILGGYVIADDNLIPNGVYVVSYTLDERISLVSYAN
jgi:hypothetical protein